MNNLEELDVWKSARIIRKNISEMVKSFPSEEKLHLVDRLIRASRSITANIAEGFGGFRFQEIIPFYRQARGSLYQLRDHITNSFKENLLTDSQFKIIQSDIDVLLSQLNKHIFHLTKEKIEKNTEKNNS
ncbi:MAG TPA: four helix bundle protein [Bacteroidales bacterium]|nr:four helix bundle protein [Bacteroidales bacterium]HQI45928.1 four helix bundle protein [Bacteroidales bacterium]